VAAETAVDISRKPLQTAFFFDDEPFTYSDVLVAGALRGEWDQFIARTRVKPQPAARADDTTLTGEAAAKIVSFRRSHHLEAASDLRDWLAARDLNSDDLLRYVRGETGGWWPDAVFSGYFGLWVDALERWLIVRHLIGAETGDDDAEPTGLSATELSGVLEIASGTDEHRARALARARRDYEAWAASAVGEAEIDRLIARRRIGWTRLEYDELIFTTDSAAAEGLACVSEDSESLEDVAARAGVPGTVRSDLQERLPAEVGSLLLALEPGQVGLPGTAGGPPELLRLRRAQPPSAADTEIRDLARAELQQAALMTAGAGRIRRVGAW
jgi:hypothetical protein